MHMARPSDHECFVELEGISKGYSSESLIHGLTHGDTERVSKI